VAAMDCDAALDAVSAITTWQTQCAVVDATNALV